MSSDAKIKRLKIIRQLSLGLIMGGAGALIGYWFGNTFSFIIPETRPEFVQIPKWLAIISLILSLKIAWILAVLFHEVGHATVGVLKGFSFNFLTAGPILIRNEDDKLRLKLNTQMSIYGGLASCLPAGEDKDVNKKMLWMVAAGPLTSVATTVIAIGLFMWLDAGRFMSRESDWLSYTSAFVLAGYIMLSGLIGLATFVPTRMGGFTSDGQRMIDLLRGGKQTELEQKFLSISFKYYKDVEPANYDIDELNALLEYPDVDRFRAYIIVYQLYYYFAKNDVDKIEQTANYLEQTVDNVPEAFRYMLYTEIAFYNALYKKDLARFTELEPKTKSGFQEKATLARLSACKALLEGDKSALSSSLEQWNKELMNLKTTAALPLEQSWLAMFEAELKTL